MSIKLAPDKRSVEVEETLGLGYVYRVRSRLGFDGEMIAQSGPRPSRDFTHRQCIPKERHAMIVKGLQDALASAQRTPREVAVSQHRRTMDSPSAAHASLVSPIAPSSFGKRLRSISDSETDVRTLKSKLRRTEWNSRKVRQCEEETAKASSKMKKLKEELRRAQAERDAALNKVRERERSESLAASSSERASTLLEASRLREAKVASQMKEATIHFEKEVDQLRRVIAEKDELLERRSAAHDESLTKIQQLSERCKRTADKVWDAKGERDAAIETKRQYEQRALWAEMELARVKKALDDAARRECAMKAGVRTMEQRHDESASDQSMMVKVLQDEISHIERLLHGGRGVGEGLVHKVKKAEALLAGLGLNFYRLPSDVGNSRQMYFDNVKFLSNAVANREPHAVAIALKRAGLLEPLFKTAPFQPWIKSVIAEALSALQKHWSPRHALMLQFEVHCSRSEYDALRHLLSFKYNHAEDCYKRMIVWRNPTNSSDTLQAPAIAARPAYEKERSELFRQCGATSTADGLFCGVGDVENAIVSMVEHYWEALDPAVIRGEKELLLVFTGDATGGWRGDSITHGEISIGSWSKGTGVSRLAALPLFIMEGDDSAQNLRNRAQPVAACYNKLKRKGKLRITINGKQIERDLKMLCAADFQFFKAMMNMSKYTSAIWCLCGTDNLFKRPSAPAQSWEEVENFYRSIDCEMKSLQTICELNHYSYEVLLGNEFKEFTCRCGYASRDEARWRADMEAHSQLTEEERTSAEKAHSCMPIHCRHKPFSPPLLHQGTLDHSADVLHLIFINIFTTFFELTMLVHVHEMPPSSREPFESYLRSIGVPIKVVKAQSVTEMKQSLTGRDAKTILSRPAEHLPALLEFAHAAPAEVAAVLAEANNEDDADQPARRPRPDDDEEFDWEPEDASQSDEEELDSMEVDGSDDNLTRLQCDAKAWDAFLKLVHAMRPFEQQDTTEYRQARAVETFNAAAGVMKEYKRLHPNTISACPHVALCVLPRQQVRMCHQNVLLLQLMLRTCGTQVAHGDHERRGADHSEAFGASIKDTIHRRTLRRKISNKSSIHKKRRADGTIEKVWRQAPLKVSRVMQAFRSAAVSERILRDRDSKAYMGRKHHLMSSMGFATVAQVAANVKAEPSDEDSIFNVLSLRAIEDLTHA